MGLTANVVGPFRFDLSHFSGQWWGTHPTHMKDFNHMDPDELKEIILGNSEPRQVREEAIEALIQQRIELATFTL